MSQFPTVIDNSMRKELVKCEMAAHYRYEMGLHSIDEKRVDLHAGKAFARGMEVMRKSFFADGMNSSDAVSAGIQALYAAYGPFIAPPGSNKTADRMGGALAYYVSQHPLESETLRPIKLLDRVFIEVGEGFGMGIQHPETQEEIIYAGNFDALCLDEDGCAWPVDEKTTSQMGDKWANQWLLDSQMTGYCWLAKRLLLRHNLPYEVKGAIINGIAIRKYDYDCVRHVTYRQDWQIDRWFRQLQRDVTNWKIAYMNGTHNQVLDHACAFYNNPCDFAPLCNSRNPERLIEGSYTVEFWHPLERK